MWSNVKDDPVDIGERELEFVIGLFQIGDEVEGHLGG